MLTIDQRHGCACCPQPGIFVLDARDGVRTDWQVVDEGEVPEGETRVRRSSARPCPRPSTSVSWCCCSAARTTARSCRRSPETSREARRLATLARRSPSWPLTVAAPTPAITQEQALREQLQRSACAVPTELLVRTWRGHRSDRGGDLELLPQEPDFVGHGGLPHSGPWDYVAEVPLLLYGPGHIEAQGAVDRRVTLADIAPTQGELFGFPFDAPDGAPLTEALVPGTPSRPKLSSWSCGTEPAASCSTRGRTPGPSSSARSSRAPGTRTPRSDRRRRAPRRSTRRSARGRSRTTTA